MKKRPGPVRQHRGFRGVMPVRAQASLNSPPVVPAALAVCMMTRQNGKSAIFEARVLVGRHDELRELAEFYTWVGRSSYV